MAKHNKRTPTWKLGDPNPYLIEDSFKDFYPEELPRLNKTEKVKVLTKEEVRAMLNKAKL